MPNRQDARRVLLDGGPAAGMAIELAPSADEIIELEVAAEPGGVPGRIAVYRRALHIPTRYTFQGMKPTK